METLEDRTAPATLVAAYAFNEGTGTTVNDSSGNGNNGTIANATWTTSGKYGDALVFNGTNARVNINDSASLHLTTGMTLEAWVNPSTVNSNWRDVIYKGNDNYWLEATSNSGSKPAAGATLGSSDVDTLGTAALKTNTWAFLTETYNGSTLTLYVNGTQVSSLAHTGNIATSTNPLQIGGDSIYGQYFKGTIDEVRVYNGALTAAQITSDMNTPIPPTAADGAGHHQRGRHDVHGGRVGHVHGDDHRLPDPDAERERCPARRRDVHRQRQRHGHAQRHPGGGDRRHVLPDLHRLQRRRQPRHPELHSHGQPGAGHHQRQQHHLHGGRGGQLHGDDHRLPDPDAERERHAAQRRDVHRQRTGALSGTPAASTGGVYHLTITATNGVGTTPPRPSP